MQCLSKAKLWRTQRQIAKNNREKLTNMHGHMNIGRKIDLISACQQVGGKVTWTH